MQKNGTIVDESICVSKKKILTLVHRTADKALDVNENFTSTRAVSNMKSVALQEKTIARISFQSCDLF